MKYTALITGASAGIGLELATLFAQNGHDLVLVARSEDKLQRLALKFAVKYKVYTLVLPQDLAKHEAPDHIFDALKQAGITVDVLVNNAGFGNYGYFRDTSLRKELDMMQVNIVALTHLTKRFLDQLPNGRPGKILNIASTAAFVPGPLMSVYYASKAYVLSFSEALAEEQRNTNITVTVLCPGATETEFKERANLEGSGLFSMPFMADAASVARAGYEGLMAGDVVVVPGLKNKLTALSARLAPRSFLRPAVKSIQEKRK
ncbi:SDR family NAD(P)-dependent oxidoreductase [Botryobacter ruber]|uniref:SDR family NAD(P)-dependent oxidoreductase n=1 Tax=Botryobacter ruber TaxID=2171629 RepID=UPI000E0C0C2E|nr:SDR family oxidoreductase [Botryobacter ruber]